MDERFFSAETGSAAGLVIGIILGSLLLDLSGFGEAGRSLRDLVQRAPTAPLAAAGSLTPTQR